MVEAGQASGTGVFDSLKGIAKAVLLELKKGADAEPTPEPKRRRRRTDPK